LYNLDDLQKIVSATYSKRSEAVEKARAIIRLHVEEFQSWTRARALGPTIDRLYKRHHRLAKEEAERAINKMSNATDADRAAIEDLARRIVNKLLHDPISRLKESEGEHGTSPGPYLHALEKLFRLEEQMENELADELNAPPKPDRGDEQSAT